MKQLRQESSLFKPAGLYLMELRCRVARSQSGLAKGPLTAKASHHLKLDIVPLLGPKVGK
jgi:hypothetical protein